MSFSDPLATAETLRKARLRYAEAFLLRRVKAKSDGMAHQQAVIDTLDELTVLEAEHYVAKLNAAAVGTCGCLVGGRHANQPPGSD